MLYPRQESSALTLPWPNFLCRINHIYPPCRCSRFYICNPDSNNTMFCKSVDVLTRMEESKEVSVMVFYTLMKTAIL